MLINMLTKFRRIWMNTVSTSTKKEQMKYQKTQELKHKLIELKNTLEGFNSRLDEKEHKGSVKHTNICTIGNHRREKRGQEMCFKK